MKWPLPKKTERYLLVLKSNVCVKFPLICVERSSMKGEIQKTDDETSCFWSLSLPLQLHYVCLMEMKLTVTHLRALKHRVYITCCFTGAAEGLSLSLEAH